MQTRSSLMAPDAVAQSPGTAGFARQPGLGYGGQAAVIRQEALNQAAAIRQAAKQDAAAIRQEAIALREPAVKEAAHLQAVILSLSEQLGQMSAYITQNLVNPGRLATTPAPTTEPAPAIAPSRPRTRPGAPAARPARTAAKPRPGSRPGAPLARPAGPEATPAGKPQGRPRQFQAMRVATAATAALFLFAVVSAGVEVATFGLKFFVFRTAVGESGPGVPTDQQFLAQEAASAHEAADKAAAAKPPAHKAHTPGRHSAKTTKTTGSEPTQQPNK
jgi:hypothetical protein